MGLVERPGSIESGDVPRYSYIRRNDPVSELSIFIDESGDFGPYGFHSPYYIITMVFHDQAVDISGPIAKLETVISLSQQRPDHYVRVGIDLDDMDVTPAESKASYQEIKDWVLAHTGLKASCLYIAQVKAKHGIIERECYNKSKTEGNRVPKCPPEKEKAIEEALRHFQMIP